jgi:hypothetical protein
MSKNLAYINKNNLKFLNVKNNLLSGTILKKIDKIFIVKSSNSAIKIKESRSKVQKGLRFL